MSTRILRLASSAVVLGALTLSIVVPAASAAGLPTSPKTSLQFGCPPIVGCTAPQPLLPGPSQLITNGDFESGGYAWATTGQARVAADPNLAHSGSGFIEFNPGDYPNPGTLSQRFTIPASAAEADFTFWLMAWAGSDALFEDRRDFLKVDILDAHGRWLHRIGLFSDQFPSSWTQAEYCNLSAFRGQTIQVQFTTDLIRQAPTIFFIDDVSVTVPTRDQIPARSC